MGEGITFINWDPMRDTVTRVHDNTSGATRGIKGKDSLNSNIHSWHVEGLKHDLGHLFSVSLWVQGCLSEKNWLFLRGNTELIVEGVMPDLLHIIPVGDDTMLNWVLQGEDTPLGLGLVSNIGVLLSHTDHDSLVPWATNNGREDSPWGVITGETGLAHAGAIVNDQSGCVFVTHLD